MPTDDGLLTLTQWLSPGFPVSAYAYSHGLEAAITVGDVTDAASAEAWIATILATGAGRNDAIFLCRAMAGADIACLSDWAAAHAGSAERWEETRAQGAAFVQTLTAMAWAPLPPEAPYPIALGVAARDLGQTPEQVARLFLHALAANLISAAVRLVPLGQAAGQGALARLAPQIAATAAEAAAATLDDLGGAAFGSDLAAMRHETQEVRLFRS